MEKIKKSWYMVVLFYNIKKNCSAESIIVALFLKETLLEIEFWLRKKFGRFSNETSKILIELQYLFYSKRKLKT